MQRNKDLRIDDRSQFALLLNQLNLVGTAVEIGVFRGDFAYELLQNWRGESLYLIDPWTHLNDYIDSWNLTDEQMAENFEITQMKLSAFNSKVHFLRMRSEEAVGLIDNESCDFIYVDANHSYKHTKNDIHLWYPKLKTGGIMAGHDYYDAIADNDLEPILNNEEKDINKEDLTSYGVKSAVDEFVREKGIQLYVTKEMYPSWYFFK